MKLLKQLWGKTGKTQLFSRKFGLTQVKKCTNQNMLYQSCLNLFEKGYHFILICLFSCHVHDSPNV